MYKKILWISLIGLIILYVMINYSYVISSIRVHEMVTSGYINDKKLFNEYVKLTASTYARGCTLGAKIISLRCTEFMPEWALGYENFAHIKNIVDEKKRLEEEERDKHDLFKQNHVFEWLEKMQEQERKNQKDKIQNILK